MGWSALPQSTPIQRSFLCLGPYSELAIRAGVLDHVANLVGRGHIPAEVVVAGVDDQDVPFADFDALLDHLAGVNIVVSAHIAQVHHRRLVHQVVHIQGGNILARRVEVDLTIQVGAEVVGMSDHLPVRPLGARRLKYLICSGS